MSKFTDKQQKVIDHDYGNIVVSASAGSGKTSVMIERLIRLISEGKASVRNILAVTFTRLAAGEMREKLSRAIIKKIQQGEDVARMRKELNDLPFATISTIDSFLNTLVSKYFYLVGVDSRYQIVAESQAEALKTLAMSEVFERLYDSDDKDLNLLMHAFITKRSDAQLRKLILSVYTFLESQLEPDKFLSSALSNYTQAGHEIAENRLIGQLFNQVNDINDLLKGLQIEALALGCAKYSDYLSQICSNVDNCEKTPAGILQVVKAIPKKPSKQKTDTALILDLSERISAYVKRLKKVVDDCFKYFGIDKNLRLDRTLKNKVLLQSLINVVKQFELEYAKQKQEQNLLDYADLARCAYKLLQNKEVIDDIKNTYKYIFVDEYQDTNGVQEGIFRLLEQNNLFIVGDV